MVCAFVNMVGLYSECFERYGLVHGELVFGGGRAYNRRFTVLHY